MRITQASVGILLKNVSLITVGTLILAFGTAVFIIPTGLVTGGVSGIAIILNKAFPVIPVDVYISLITWILFLLGVFILGRDFAIKTLLSGLIYPPAVSAFMKLSDPYVLDGFFYIEGSPHGELSLIVAACAGGICVGVGCALTFIGGGSTGGTDIVAFSVCKILRNIKSSSLIFVIDAATIIIGMFIVKDLIISLLGILSAFVAAIMIDKILLHSPASNQK